MNVLGVITYSTIWVLVSIGVLYSTYFFYNLWFIGHTLIAAIGYPVSLIMILSFAILSTAKVFKIGE